MYNPTLVNLVRLSTCHLATMELNSGATKQNNRHSQVACRICGKTMRDDTMKRHMKTHADLNAMDEDKKRAELERRKEAHEYREKQR